MKEQKEEKVERGEVIGFIKRKFLIWISLIMVMLGGVITILDLCGMAFKEEWMRSWSVPISRVALGLFAWKTKVQRIARKGYKRNRWQY